MWRAYSIFVSTFVVVVMAACGDDNPQSNQASGGGSAVGGGDMGGSGGEGVCVPECARGQQCGDDSCGSQTCGACSGSEQCTAQNHCMASSPETYLAVVNATETIADCMAPCAVQFDAQATEGLSWQQVRDGTFLWNFDDGGSNNDSQGFLAATVYETPGTYQPTVTVNGQLWTAQTINVVAPDWVGCVSPANVGADRFSDCPDGQHHFDDVSTALATANGKSHILLDRAYGGSYGQVPTALGEPTMLGAYGAEPSLPQVDAMQAYPAANWRYVELDVSASGEGAFAFTNGFGVLLLRVNSHGLTSISHMYGEDGFFLIDSQFRENDYVFIGGGINRPTAKGSHFIRTTAGQSTFRVSGGEKELFQNCTFDCDGCGPQVGLTVRANTDWVLVQGNTFLENAGAAADDGDPNVVHRHILWERNFYDLTDAEQNFQNSFSMRDSVIRNNILVDPASGGAGVAFMVVTASGEQSGNVWVVNNTIMQSFPDKSAVFLDCELGGCVSKNNLMHATDTMTKGCLDGGEQSNNWCVSTNYCLLPDASEGTCVDPAFVSLNPESPDFGRPGPETPGIDAADPNFSAPDDFFGAPRTVPDVGAVER